MMPFTVGLDTLLVTKVVLYVFSRNYLNIKVDSYDSLPLEENIDFPLCYNTH